MRMYCIGSNFTDPGASWLEKKESCNANYYDRFSQVWKHMLIVETWTCLGKFHKRPLNCRETAIVLSRTSSDGTGCGNWPASWPVVMASITEGRRAWPFCKVDCYITSALYCQCVASRRYWETLLIVLQLTHRQMWQFAHGRYTLVSHTDTVSNIHKYKHFLRLRSC